MAVTVVEYPVAAVQVGQEGAQSPVVGKTLKLQKCSTGRYKAYQFT